MDTEVDAFDQEYERFELTNIKVKEVSLVDRAANKRKFLVMKREAGSVVDPAYAATVGAKAAKNFGDSPAADLDRKDQEQKTPTIEPAVETPAIKSEIDIIVTETSSGMTVSVAAPPSFAEGSTEYALKLKIQAAWMGAIGAIRARLDAMSEAVQKPSDSLYVDYGAYNHLEAIRCMLECFYDIGGPEWEMEVAAVSAAAAKGENVQKKREEMAKIGRAISTSRMRSLKDMHGKVTDLYKMFGELMSEVDTEVVTDEKTKSETPPAPVVADAPATAVVAQETVAAAPAFAAVVDISQDPAFKALKDAMEKQAELIKQQTEQMAELKTKAEAQDKELAKARGTVRSNALTQEPQTKQTDYVWPRDMASSEANYRR